MMRDYASFGPVRSDILDLSVYDREAGSSLMLYKKLEGGGASQNDGQMDGRTDRQTDALLKYAQACIFLSCLTL